MSAADARSDPPDDEAKAKEQARVTALKIVVIVLGAILIGLALVVFSTLIWRAVKGSGGSTSPATAARGEGARLAAPSVSIGNGSVQVPLPRGARIVSTSLGDGRLAVTIEDGETATTILFDAATLVETGRITWRRAP
jgi:hypothetical protein